MTQKRIYTNVAVEADAGGFKVALDERTVKTPAQQPLIIANQVLAEAVAGEWRAQDKEIRHETMPITRYVFTVLDRVTPGRAEVVAETVKFAETDLLCYRAEAPRELAKRQAAAWQPLLDWARARYHAALTTTVGVMAIDQDSNALARLRKAVEAENDFTLAGLHIATAISGSLVVGLALMEKEIDAERAWQVSHIEEHWQLERWGEDEELSDRLAAMRQEFHEAENFIALARV
ncbi:MAG: ATPase [Rhodospirillaceae bacterium]|nr:ATPase [Rhodospirillaceae bacterium]